MNKIISKIKCSLGFHKWEPYHEMLYNIWIKECSCCFKTKISDLTNTYEK